MAQTLYEILQVSPLASRAVIKAAYRSLAQQHHPDKVPDDPDAGDRLAAINRAFAVLYDPAKRAAHDTSLELAAKPQAENAARDQTDERRGGNVQRRPLNNKGTRRFVFRSL
jgi:curved DNA-binding protein CbpA